MNAETLALPGLPTNIDTEQMADITKAAIEKILSNPSQISSVLDQLKGNQAVFSEVVKFIDSNPNLKNQAMNVAHNNNAMGEMNKMSLKERRKLANQARKARSAMLASQPAPVKGLFINNSRQIKSYVIPSGFPANTKYESSQIANLGHGLSLYHCDSGPRNRLVNRLTGLNVQGEVIVVRRDDSDGNVITVTENELKTLLATGTNTSTVESEIKE